MPKLALFGDPALIAPKEPVTEFDDTLKANVESLFDALKEYKAIGLAAQHIGLTQAFVCIHLEDDSPALALINPEITRYSQESDTAQETSVSFPAIAIQVPRSTSITLSYQDLEGKEHILECSGLLARCIQHEVDHLNNILFYHRASKQHQARITTRLKQLKRYTQKALKKSS